MKPIALVSVALLRLAVRRIPAQLRDELFTEWHAELLASLHADDTNSAARLANGITFSWSLLVRGAVATAREMPAPVPSQAAELAKRPIETVRTLLRPELVVDSSRRAAASPGYLARHIVMRELLAKSGTPHRMAASPEQASLSGEDFEVWLVGGHD